MARMDREIVLKAEEAKWKQAPDLPHHHGG
jgi:hypothetical protein